MTKFIGWIRANGGTRRWLSGLLLILALGTAVAAYLAMHGEILATVEYAPPLTVRGTAGGTAHVVDFRESASAATAPTLVVTYRDTPPDMVVYSPGRYSGPLRYVIEEAAARIGYGIEWRLASFGDSVTAVEQGAIDIVTNAHFKTAEREKTMRFSASLGHVPSVINFLLRSDDPSVIKTLADLKGHTLGFRRSVYYFEKFDTLDFFKKSAYGDDKEMVKGFANRAIDVIVVNNKQGVERALAAGGITASHYKYASLVIEEQADLYLLYSRVAGRQQVFDRLDQAFLKMEEEDLISDIYHSFNADPPKPYVEGTTASAPAKAPGIKQAVR